MKKAAVFILLGQSNAVGHGVPMQEEDKIKTPLKNVFGLDRAQNQSFDTTSLVWSGYKSGGMNLGETQDDTYSVANCLARLWQDAIDNGESLPDLHIVQIAIGSQGVTEKYMWYPKREKKLVPGKLKTADISLYPFTVHILSLLAESLQKLGKEPEYIGLHWRGGENDASIREEELQSVLKSIYDEIFSGFSHAIGQTVPVIIHRLAMPDRCLMLDPSGESLKSMHYINTVFDTLSAENENISIFDVTKAPHFVSDVRGNGIFIEDFVHFTPETNAWVAAEILRNYKEKM